MLLLVAMAIIAGCSTAIPGAASPVRAGNGGSVAELPHRPRELPLDNVDPCSLLTSNQRANLGLNEPNPRFSTNPVEIFGGPSCSFFGSNPRNIGVSFTLTTNNGIEALTQPGAVLSEVIPTTVLEFPAVILREPSLPPDCLLIVDVAQGQFLNIFYTDNDLPSVPVDQMCAAAKDAAAQALLTLEAGN